MKEVWVVMITEVIAEDGIYPLYASVFSKEEDARKRFEEKIIEIQHEFEMAELEVEQEYIDNDYFEIWEDGYFSQNHSIVKIQKLEVL